MSARHHYEKCDRCEEKYWDDDIAKFLYPERVIDDVTGEVERICRWCVKKEHDTYTMTKREHVPCRVCGHKTTHLVEICYPDNPEHDVLEFTKKKHSIVLCVSCIRKLGRVVNE